MVEQVFEITRNFLRHVLGADATVLLSDNAGALHAVSYAVVGRESARLQIEPRFAEMAFSSGSPVECGPLGGAGFAMLYLPLEVPMRVRGVVNVAPVDGDAY